MKTTDKEYIMHICGRYAYHDEDKNLVYVDGHYSSPRFKEKPIWGLRWADFRMLCGFFRSAERCAELNLPEGRVWTISRDNSCVHLKTICVML